MAIRKKENRNKRHPREKNLYSVILSNNLGELSPITESGSQDTKSLHSLDQL